MKLLTIGIGNFRSIGEDVVWIDLQKRATVLIGANNCGKSNVLKAIDWARKSEKGGGPLDEIDQHGRNEVNEPRLVFKAEFDESDKVEALIGREFTLDFYHVPTEKGLKWIKRPFEEFNSDDIQRICRIAKYDVRSVAKLAQESGYEKIGRQFYASLKDQIPEIHIIPEFRKIVSSLQYRVDGQGIIEMLANWQNPPEGQEHLRKRFDSVKALLRRLLDMPQLEMDLPHTEKDKILIEYRGFRIDYRCYGTGVHELVILAIAVLFYENALLGIEEPEIHLHTRLQKELLRFLMKETSNRYLITTHSNAFIDPSDDVDVLHLKAVDRVTVSRRVESSLHTLELLRDLGYQPSDLLQANAVIWVEGPSDRIYIKRWLELLESDLQEGIDYSIMFYAGDLRKHLSLERELHPNPDDLIQLLRINQASVFVMDSDREDAATPLNPTKHRIESECQKNGVYCWTTDGREIENYLQGPLIARAYAEITGLAEREIPFGPFDRLEDALKSAFGKDWQPRWSYNSSKPNAARNIVRHVHEDDMGDDLRRHLNMVIKTIREGALYSAE